MEKESFIELSKMLILKEFDFLGKLDYETTFEISNDKTFIECLSVNYINSEKRREVDISYTKGKVYEDIKYTFSVSVTRIPYSGVKDFFGLSNFLESKNMDFNTSTINYFDEKEAEMILRKIANHLKLYASNIIAGTEWFDDYWPRW